jgi:hypothetical protein
MSDEPTRTMIYPSQKIAELCEENAKLRATLAEAKAQVARPLSEWTEEVGDALWWRFPVEEPPYVGSPNDRGLTVEIHSAAGMACRGAVGGWPGYHTHWTPLPAPRAAPEPA